MNETDIFAGGEPKILHLSPEIPLLKVLEKYDGIDYHPRDFDSKDYEFIDIRKIEEKDETFDIIICSHVLEHIKEDRAATKELYRVLKPKGVALIIVPLTTRKITEEFDQIDSQNHWRACGEDYIDRIKESGFKLELYHPSEDLRKKLGINQYGNELFICKK